MLGFNVIKSRFSECESLLPLPLQLLLVLLAVVEQVELVELVLLELLALELLPLELLPQESIFGNYSLFIAKIWLHGKRNQQKTHLYAVKRISNNRKTTPVLRNPSVIALRNVTEDTEK